MPAPGFELAPGFEAERVLGTSLGLGFALSAALGFLLVALELDRALVLAVDPVTNWMDALSPPPGVWRGVRVCTLPETARYVLAAAIAAITAEADTMAFPYL